MAIAANITGRELGEQVFTLLSELVAGETCEPEAKARAWRVLRTMVDQIIGDKPDALEAISERPGMSLAQAESFGNKMCPFRKYRQQEYCEVPVDYLRWIVDQNQELEVYVDFREDEEFEEEDD